LWGGLECTYNRVGERYFDQQELTGHAHRPEDIDRIAALGIRTIRYPLIWERAQPSGQAEPDWSLSDERLDRLQRCAIRPILGLCHHGSGPRHLSLLDGDFAPGLADFSAKVAARYPWVVNYTPVNEPLTTARFSALYGHWYPHKADAPSCARALLNQCEAVVRSMRAIRAINPDARLVQTEDLGKTFSTPAVAYQADFENTRRWLTWDLLCGRVRRGHPMWDYLRWTGIQEKSLNWFLDNTCPPDIIGINYYVTSERFLDPAPSLSRRTTWRQQPRPLCGRRSGPRAGARSLWRSGALERGLGALPNSVGHHGSSLGLHARRTGALVCRDLASRPGRR